MEKINVAELLKNCPSGMELDSPMYDNLYFDKVEEDYGLPISCYTMYHGSKTSVYFTEFGSYNTHKTAKCVIFPKGKTTWEGFHRPFEPGDIVITDNNEHAFIYSGENNRFWECYCGVYCGTRNVRVNSKQWSDKIHELRLATEEEKEKLFQVIKDNGYKWNAETKTLEKVEPKFKVGDWVTDGVSKCQIYFIDGTQYWYSENCILGSIESVDKQYHLWTINDAKDNDILVTVNDENRPFIYKGCLDPNHPDSPVAYCGIDADGYFCSGGGKFNHWWTVEKVQPATKEQRDTLMKAMTDAGYTFDFDKKELKLLISNGGDFESNNSKQKSVEWSEKDEKRRKAILTGLIDCRDAPDLGWSNFGGISIDDCIAWLEKQVDPKFHKGDWVVFNNQPEKGSIYQVKDVHNYEYTLQHILGGYMSISFSRVDMLRLWTIDDAKDGDVLFHSDSASNGIFIFKEILQRGTLQKVICYCDYDSEDGFCLGENHTCCWADSKILRPATEEQRNRLFQKMREAGYSWNPEIKILEKLTKSKFKVGDKVRHKNNHNVVVTITNIEKDYYACGTNKAFWFTEQNDYELIHEPKFKVGDKVRGKYTNSIYTISGITPTGYELTNGQTFTFNAEDCHELVTGKFDITTLKPFDKVLVRNTNNGRWRGQFYMSYDKNEEYPFECTYNCWMQCIPFEGNEYLLDKTDNCNDFYKIW